MHVSHRFRSGCAASSCFLRNARCEAGLDSAVKRQPQARKRALSPIHSFPVCQGQGKGKGTANQNPHAWRGWKG